MTKGQLQTFANCERHMQAMDQALRSGQCLLTFDTSAECVAFRRLCYRGRALYARRAKEGGYGYPYGTLALSFPQPCQLLIKRQSPPQGLEGRVAEEIR